MTNILCNIPDNRPWLVVARFSIAFFTLVVVAVASGCASDLQWVEVSEEKKGFVLTESGDRFVPWGFNYDHDDKGRLLEDYWNLEWSTVEEDFSEMKQLGANVVRIHLQLGRFMKGPNEPNAGSLERLGQVVDLAERLHIYLDITGLGCYHKKDVPQWYDELSEQRRWDVQERFWEAVAKCCAVSPAVFCYDLMNEPVVGGRVKRTDWLGPAFAGKHFVQFIAIQQGSRERHAIAVRWISKLTAAIRKHDRRHLITVGLVPWSLPGKGLTSGFEPAKVAEELDFISVHLYPESGKVTEKIETLKAFCVGKPVVIEEMFPLKCSVDELERFVEDSCKFASGWVGFYWGKTPQEYKERGRLVDMMTLSWLELFQSHAKKMQN